MKKKRTLGKTVAESRVYLAAKDKASKLSGDPDKLNDLLDRAGKRANAQKRGLSEVWDRLTAAFRLLRSYASGRYTDIPVGSLISIIATVLYFVIPTDLIPDFLLGFGFVDDVALIAWVLKKTAEDLDRFLEWEKNERSSQSVDDSPEGKSSD